ncbi:hypothetical protein THOM_0923 [Trachipleistophora hominis]|uniref:Uncharacterized protein n=1 Tax=Trachipleistophora hominis TaxID=72359 RepID=L7JXF3_TRAHO|nr:hypothetical protein THOM_0923 [Trachipleistophora hominis]
MNITYQSCTIQLPGMPTESARDLYYLKLDLRRRPPLTSTTNIFSFFVCEVLILQFFDLFHSKNKFIEEYLLISEVEYHCLIILNAKFLCIAFDVVNNSHELLFLYFTGYSA